MVESAGDLDIGLRMAAFGHLAELRRTFGTEMPRRVLEQGFQFENSRVSFVGPSGIWKPAIFPTMPLSITTAPPTDRKIPPYDDELGTDGVIAYRYRGKDPNHRDNVGLRTAMERQVPLVYFFGTDEGWYEAIWPVFVVGDNRAHLTFTLVAEQQGRLLVPLESQADTSDRRRYITREVQQRLHQRVFRGQVIRAYAVQCAICRLRQRELLEAAHILSDTDPRGQPIIPNGLAMCSLHHTAYDTNVIGISPDYVIHVRGDVLSEHDGPMLQHGLQGFEQKPLVLPRRQDERPDRGFLEERFDDFKRAG